MPTISVTTGIGLGAVAPRATATVSYIRAESAVNYILGEAIVAPIYDSKNRKLYESIGTSDAAYISFNVNPSPESITISNEIIVLGSTKGVAETVTASEIFTRTVTFSRTFNDSVSLIDYSHIPGYMLNDGVLNSVPLGREDGTYIPSISVITRKDEAQQISELDLATMGDAVAITSILGVSDVVTSSDTTILDLNSGLTDTASMSEIATVTLLPASILNNSMLNATSMGS